MTTPSVLDLILNILLIIYIVLACTAPIGSRPELAVAFVALALFTAFEFTVGWLPGTLSGLFCAATLLKNVRALRRRSHPTPAPDDGPGRDQ